MEERTKLQKIILVILAVMALVAGGLLVCNRTTPGLQFRGEFLKRSVVNEITVYSGKCKGTELYISVTPLEDGAAVDFTAENGWERGYVVSGWNSGMGKSPAEPVLVTDRDGAELFRGFLWSNDYLMDEHGDIDLTHSGFSVSITSTKQEEEGTWTDYEPSMLRIVKLAMAPSDVCRGSVGLYLLMLLLTVMLAVDILYPELFFQLKHCLDVRDPEPSDFYIAVQRLCWVVYPVLLMIGYYMAVAAIE